MVVVEARALDAVGVAAVVDATPVPGAGEAGEGLLPLACAALEGLAPLLVVPVVAVVMVVVGSVGALLSVYRARAAAVASLFSVMRREMKLSRGCSGPTMVEARWIVYRSRRSSSVSGAPS